MKNAKAYYSNNKQGFTIIEVVLVLAIAGLIFLMVFIALPALQRSQRDAQRKKQANSVIAAINNYAANNRGRTDRLWNNGKEPVKSLIDWGYLKADEMRDPSTGEVYSWQKDAVGGNLYTNYKKIRAGYYGIDTGYCQGNDPIDSVLSVQGINEKSWAVVFGLEGGGYICVSNDMR